MIKEREMVKCGACDEYHYKDECETVIIRIVKGKNCKLGNPTEVKQQKINPFSKREPILNANDIAVGSNPIPNTVSQADIKRTNPSVVPAQFRGVFAPPGAGGDEITRKV